MIATLYEKKQPLSGISDKDAAFMTSVLFVKDDPLTDYVSGYFVRMSVHGTEQDKQIMVNLYETDNHSNALFSQLFDQKMPVLRQSLISNFLAGLAAYPSEERFTEQFFDLTEQYTRMTQRYLFQSTPKR